MKKILICFFALFSLVNHQALAQQIKTTAGNRGDEQGLDIPKNLVLEKDKIAYTEMRQWYIKNGFPKTNALNWFNDVKFGCFVHWGVYADAAGEWNGKAYLGYAEHLMRSQKIPLNEYKQKLIIPFKADKFNAKAWIDHAVMAGMKYFIVTAKHHDGFAMYPSAYPYNIQLTQMKIDPMQELADEARKQGMKFGYYYSHAFDWEHPDAPGNDWDYDNPGGDKLLHGKNWWETYPEFLPRAEKYVYEKSIPQIIELINRYHPDILWFDTPHKLPLYLNLAIVKAIRTAAPDMVLNGRLANTANYNFGDYENSGDRAAYFRNSDKIWESIPTTNESYGYSKADKSHKSPKHFVQLLASAVAKGGNILMNVGPMGNGSWDTTDVRIFKTVGNWMHQYGESIYGTQKTDLPVQSWGVVTQKGNHFYLHVFKWPASRTITVTGLQGKVKKCTVLANQQVGTLKTGYTDEQEIMVYLPKEAADSMNTVIKLECKEAIVQNTAHCLLSTEMENRLQVFDALTPGKKFSYGDGKENKQFVKGWVSDKQLLQWNVKNNSDTWFKVAITYNTAEKDESGTMQLHIDDKVYAVEYTASTQQNKTIELKTPVIFAKGKHSIALHLATMNGKQAMQPLYITVEAVKEKSE